MAESSAGWTVCRLYFHSCDIMYALSSHSPRASKCDAKHRVIQRENLFFLFVFVSGCLDSPSCTMCLSLPVCVRRAIAINARYIIIKYLAERVEVATGTKPKAQKLSYSTIAPASTPAAIISVKRVQKEEWRIYYYYVFHVSNFRSDCVPHCSDAHKCFPVAQN